ncbi:hypothetical protein [Rhizomonospora bruguierae]|uniref:hypothetical protein n=1 Tax=Rhizomonospora bruguierae TaxID=1581705 RepID=UPI001BCFC42C|nr:hypothetical protein [Micromonospora sp. NBRC 107566]
MLKKGAAAAAMSVGLGATVLAAPAYAAAAPGCVSRGVNSGTITQTAWMRNDCGYRLNAYIVWDFGVDGGCQTLNPGATATSTVAIVPRRFAGVNLC